MSRETYSLLNFARATRLVGLVALGRVVSESHHQVRTTSVSKPGIRPTTTGRSGAGQVPTLRNQIRVAAKGDPVYRASDRAAALISNPIAARSTTVTTTPTYASKTGVP